MSFEAIPEAVLRQSICRCWECGAFGNFEEGVVDALRDGTVGLKDGKVLCT